MEKPKSAWGPIHIEISDATKQAWRPLEFNNELYTRTWGFTPRGLPGVEVSNVNLDHTQPSEVVDDKDDKKE